MSTANGVPAVLFSRKIVTAIDSKARRISSYMPLTVTTPERSLILGAPGDEPEFYNLRTDPGEQENLWHASAGEGEALREEALGFLERQGTPEEYLAPRRRAAERAGAPDG